MKIFRLISVLIVLSVFISCSDSTNTPTPTDVSKDLIPLAVGNQWNYIDSSFLDGKIVVTNTIYKTTRLATASIGFKEYKLFAQLSTNEKGEPIGQDFLSNAGDGIYSFGSENDPFNLIYRNFLLKYPVQENEVWDATYHYFNSNSHRFSHDTSSIRCMSVNELVTVPAGSYKSIKYLYTIDSDTQIIEFWKPGVGLVSYEILEKSDLVFKRVLKSFISSKK